MNRRHRRRDDVKGSDQVAKRDLVAVVRSAAITRDGGAKSRNQVAGGNLVAGVEPQRSARDRRTYDRTRWLEEKSFAG